jgi:hypothetical protein
LESCALALDLDLPLGMPNIHIDGHPLPAKTERIDPDVARLVGRVPQIGIFVVQVDVKGDGYGDGLKTFGRAEEGLRVYEWGSRCTMGSCELREVG